jgi:hypothetical protein
MNESRPSSDGDRDAAAEKHGSLTINDSAVNTGQSYEFLPGSVSRTAVAGGLRLVFNYSDAPAVTLNAGTGGNAFTVNNTTPTSIIRINGIAPGDSVKVKAHTGPVYLNTKVLPGVATALDISLPSGAVAAGSLFPITVTALDAAGNVATSYMGKVYFHAGTSQTMSQIGSYKFNASDRGMHRHKAKITMAGSLTVGAADRGPNSIGGWGTLMVTPAAPRQLDLSAPASVRSGATFALNAQIKDTYGNIITNYTGTLKFSTPDKQTVLPAPYTFQASDRGQSSFSLSSVKRGRVTVFVASTDQKLSGCVEVTVT